MSDFNLDDLKPLELPEKEEKVTIGGKEQTIKIRPLSGVGVMLMRNLPDDKIERLNMLYVIYLSNCIIGCDSAKAEYWLKNDVDEAMRVANVCFRYSNEFAEKKETEKAEALKN